MGKTSCEELGHNLFGGRFRPGEAGNALVPDGTREAQKWKLPKLIFFIF